jgi:hypothetical protein
MSSMALKRPQLQTFCGVAAATRTPRYVSRRSTPRAEEKSADAGTFSDLARSRPLLRTETWVGGSSRGWQEQPSWQRPGRAAPCRACPGSPLWGSRGSGCAALAPRTRARELSGRCPSLWDFSLASGAAAGRVLASLLTARSGRATSPLLTGSEIRSDIAGFPEGLLRVETPLFA